MVSEQIEKFQRLYFRPWDAGAQVHFSCVCVCVCVFVFVCLCLCVCVCVCVFLQSDWGSLSMLKSQVLCEVSTHQADPNSDGPATECLQASQLCTTGYASPFRAVSPRGAVAEICKHQKGFISAACSHSAIRAFMHLTLNLKNGQGAQCSGKSTDCWSFDSPASLLTIGKAK